MTVETKLEAYKRLLLSWNAKVNLIGPEAQRNLEAHIQEALEAGEILSPVGEVLDVGSGGGLPAIPMAIQAEGRARFHLVDADSRKWAFLKFVSRECELNCQVYGDRLQTVVTKLPPELQFDLVTSRAVGHASDWLPSLGKRLSREGSVALFQSSPQAEEIEGFSRGETHKLGRGSSNYLVLLHVVPRGT